MNLKGKSFLKLLDFTAEEISGLIELAAKLKEEKEKVMLELMIMKSSQVITEEEYKKETVELWKK